MGNKFENAMKGVALCDFATEIQNRLLAEGFILHRYDASSTNSVYLKLDYGVCNSIRISDHEGKGYLKYRYNIGTDIKKKETKKDKWARHYYPVDAADDMIAQIKKDRAEKKAKYGERMYERFMRENKKNHANDKGFWSQSRRVF